MARPTLTDEQRQIVRNNIREAAAKLYVENGRSSVSVRAVAESADVSVGTVYAYFGSLSELMQSLWRQPVRKLVQHMARLVEGAQTPVDQLDELLQAYVRFAVDNPQVFKSALLFVRPESAELPEQTDPADDQFFTLFTQAIASGQKQGQFRIGDPSLLAQMVISAVHGSLALPINFHRLALHNGTEVAEQTIAAQLEWLQN